MGWLRENWHRILVHTGALAPLMVLGVNYLANNLPFNLERYLMLRAGTIGLILLVASLACTPLTTLSGRPGFVQVRRALGLYGFMYVIFHLWVYAVFDNQLDYRLMWRDLGERRSMTVGLISVLALIPLALTSTKGWQRRLGPRWRTLHRLVFLATPLSVLHYYWLDRDFVGAPLTYAAIVAVLLLLRLPPLRQAIVRLRRRLFRPQPRAGLHRQV
jgi:methionine sulfoxide reductase heme-binding subunit